MGLHTEIITPWRLLRLWREWKSGPKERFPTAAELAGALVQVCGSVERALQMAEFVMTTDAKTYGSLWGTRTDLSKRFTQRVREILIRASRPEVTEAYLLGVGAEWEASLEENPSPPDPEELAGSMIEIAGSLLAAPHELIRLVANGSSQLGYDALNVLNRLITRG